MDLVSVFGPVLAVGLLIERILEAAWGLLEMFPGISGMKTNNPEQYGRTKQVVSIIAAFIVGVLVCSTLGTGFFAGALAGLGIEGIGADADRLITGLIAGAIAPYVHQVIELLMKTQRLLQSTKEKVEQETSALASGTE